MHQAIDHFGVAIAAVTGVLAARGKQVDLFGVIVLALVTAFGGGTIRDLLLGSQPVFWVQDANFLLNGVFTAVVTFYLVRYHELPLNVLLIADAFVLAFFTMAGLKKGLALHTSVSIAIAMGVITGVVGGILRDLLIGEIPLVFRRETYLYATAAFAGACLYVLLEQIWGMSGISLLAGLTTTLLLRLAGMRWQIALPVFRPRNPKPRKPE